jgi:hypothetical protein
LPSLQRNMARCLADAPAVAAMGRPALFLLSMDMVVYLKREPGHAAHKLHSDEITRCRHPR